MNEVNKTLFIPLYGKALVSKKGIILKDPTAERIWEAESFPIRGKSRSKWLAYNMAMRARVFDDWTDDMLAQDQEALVLHVGCGLDSRCERVLHSYKAWIDCDLPEVAEIRKKYFKESDFYQIRALDATSPEQLFQLPDSRTAIVILEGVTMYLTSDQLHSFFETLQNKYGRLHILADFYTEFGARASKYKNTVNDVGVNKLYGFDDLQTVLEGLKIRFKAEHTFTPSNLINELKPAERGIFRLLFTGKIYRKIYRLLELEM